MTAADALRTAGGRRRELHRAMVALEATLAVPTRAPAWCESLRRDAAALHEALLAHVAVTEAEGGVMEEMLEEAPRLDAQVSALQADHPRLLAAAVALVDEAAAMPPEPEPAAADQARAHALELLGGLARHRQRGADLVYEAFEVDIGGWS